MPRQHGVNVAHASGFRVGGVSARWSRGGLARTASAFFDERIQIFSPTRQTSPSPSPHPPRAQHPASALNTHPPTHHTRRPLSPSFDNTTRRADDSSAHICPAWVRSSPPSPRWRRFVDIAEPAPSSLCEFFADDASTAPKKKQEKMNLGEFLTNQCMHTLDTSARGKGARDATSAPARTVNTRADTFHTQR